MPPLRWYCWYHHLLLCVLAIPQATARESPNVRSGVRNVAPHKKSFVGNDYTLWSKNDTYFQWCRTHYIRNVTWGRPLAKFVDKVHAKSLVEAMGVEGLEIPRTYAIYNSQNISEFTLEVMQRLPQPYIIKPTHGSGGVSRVKNNTLSCISRCKDRPQVTGEKAISTILQVARTSLSQDYSIYQGEPQYKDIPHQIIIEEDVQVGSVTTDVSYWYASNGHPLFVSIQCDPTRKNQRGTEMSRAFVNTKFERLKLRLQSQQCQHELVKPKNWDHQVRVVSSLAKNVPGIVRIDLYAGDDRIIFSEFTYTTGFCANYMNFKPRVADGLLLAFDNGGIDPSKATPEFIKNTIHGTSWVFVTLLKGRTVSPASSAAFPSPVDLCESVNSNTNYNSIHWDQNEKIKHCITVAKEAANRHLHCIVGSDKNSTLWGVSDHKTPSMSAVMSHVDWGRALTLFFAVILMTKMKVGTTLQKNQYINNILYYAVMAIVMRLTLPHVKAMFSNHSILDIVRHSFEAFRYVHPMESPHIALSHFTTYWFAIAAWRSRSLRNFFFWQLLRETVSASLNEYCHLIEDKDIVHCSRVAFITSMKEYAFDNLIREYLIAPFFVYGYLLPKFIIYWSRKMLGNNDSRGVLLFMLTMFALIIWHAKNKHRQKKMTLEKKN